MKINKRLLPLKAHFLFFLASVAPIKPFLTVVGVQLGISLSIQGVLFAVCLLLPIVVKPLVAVLADAFSHLRKMIFIFVLALVFGSYSSIWFIPPLKDSIVLKGQLVMASVKTDALSKKPTSDAMVYDDVSDFLSQTLLFTYNPESCYIDTARKCLQSCKEPCIIIGNMTKSDISVKRVNIESVFQADLYQLDPISHLENETLVKDALNVESLTNASGHLYQLEGVNVSWDFLADNISLECSEAEWNGSSCATVLLYWEFWVYVLLIMMAEIGFSIAYSVSDAITVDSTRNDPGSYGNQRAWGAIGWGLAAPLGGLLVDLWSGSSVTKDYSPAFLLLLIFGCIDLIICSSSLKVPQMEGDTNILKVVRPLLVQPRFVIFCCFVVLNGMFNGILFRFIFVMQEEMAQGTSAMSYIKFLQGLTIFVQCAMEAPFMFINGWFMKKLGPQGIISLVFLAYTVRHLGLSLSISYGFVWATLFTESLHGITMGLGYPAIVEYAAEISPPGTSTTIQSLVHICYDSFGLALASLLGGILFDTFGGFRTYLVTGVLCFIVFILHVFVMKFFPAKEEDTTEVEGVNLPSIQTATENPKDDFSFSKEETQRSQNRGAPTEAVKEKTLQSKIDQSP